MEKTEFAVVDVETTGFYAKGHDRIVEIAVLRVDSRGNLIDEYFTLVNPDRDVGPSNIHGIYASDILHAPRFSEIAGDVISRIAGAVFVGHNVFFDFNFVSSEINRMGHNVPETPCLCTIHLTKRIDSSIPNRKLETCCLHFGISQEESHSAYDDALATKKLLIRCFDSIQNKSGLSHADLGINPRLLRRELWPNISLAGKSFSRQHAAQLRNSEKSYIAQLIERIPLNHFANAEVDCYLATLDKILEDRIVTFEEANSLYKIAKDFKLSKEQLIEIHHQYLRELIYIALTDNIISKNEERDLLEVSRVLSISKSDFNEIMQECETKKSKKKENKYRQQVVKNLEGKTVCFTGELRCRINCQTITRDVAIKIASNKGLIIKNSITKGVDFLVTADPNSLSSKARKARQYGIRIIAEPAFWNMLGIKFE